MRKNQEYADLHGEKVAAQAGCRTPTCVVTESVTPSGNKRKAAVPSPVERTSEVSLSNKFWCGGDDEGSRCFEDGASMVKLTPSGNKIRTEVPAMAPIRTSWRASYSKGIVLKGKRKSIAGLV